MSTNNHIAKLEISNDDREQIYRSVISQCQVVDVFHNTAKDNHIFTESTATNVH